MSLTEDKGYTLDGTVDLGGRPALAYKTRRWKACTFVLVYQALERFASYGVAANLVNYMTTQLHQGLISSIRNVNNWSGSSWIAPILGAYVADSYVGRFWTITLSLLIYAMGLVLLALTTSLESLILSSTDEICSKFDDFDPQEKELKVSFFNWWSFNSFFGALLATLFVVYIEERFGRGLEYGISTIGFLLFLINFFLGTPIYRHKTRKTRSPSKDFIRVLAAAFRNRQLQLPSSPSELHEFDLQHYISSRKRQIHHTPHLRFSDKAAIKEGKIEVSNAQFTMTQVEGAKLILGMFPCNFWATEVTIFVKQGATLERSLGPKFQISAASLWSFVVLTTLISLPIYDHYFVPFMRLKTGNHRGITLLQRLGIGMAIQIIAMAISCVVEVQRMHVIRKHHRLGPEEIVPMSIFWLLPQHVLLGIADAFLFTGLLEFFSDQSPEEMQVLETTFYTSTIAAGSFFSSFLVTMVDKFTRKVRGQSWIGNNLNDCHLDYHYGFLLVIASLNFGIFLWASNRYIYKRENTDVNGHYNDNITDRTALGTNLN